MMNAVLNLVLSRQFDKEQDFQSLVRVFSQILKKSRERMMKVPTCEAANCAYKSTIVQKPDSVIHWIVIFSTAAEEHEKAAIPGLLNS